MEEPENSSSIRSNVQLNFTFLVNLLYKPMVCPSIQLELAQPQTRLKHSVFSVLMLVHRVSQLERKVPKWNPRKPT